MSVPRITEIMEATAPPSGYKEYILLNADKADPSVLPVSGIPDGCFCHIVDTAVYGRFFVEHWYDMATGAVIV